ncbi:M20/M25/M40 family metallo-hydrolase [Candidatus Bathyarchaeota archaeon]|nr:MAG: M20/M25/M40 family metallo-hydrolase [Candidatus Bathyarchaeota archaeon]TMI31522.1 MAG: M20/M25/M40 family metallo-hydrolase [Candidatus Bathyarchaeota archaeon]
MDLDRRKVFAYIDQHIPEHTSKLQELVRQPSISPENKGVRECAGLLLRYYKELGCVSSLVETSGNPVVFGKYDAGADRTIVVYLMYDTMPVDEPGWTVDPLAGSIREMAPFGRCLVARGAYNTKGELRAFLNACESIRATGQELPVNLLLVAEGEEELGSRHLPEFFAKKQKDLAEADAVFFPFCGQDRNGKVLLFLGVKGIVFFELELDGASWGRGPREFGVHGSNKAWVDSPAWRMVQALATMTSPDGNRVLVKDFYKNAKVPTDEDRELLQRLEKTFDESPQKTEMRVDRFIGDAKGIDAFKKYLFDPTLNIDGLWSGYTGPETKTLLPHKMTVKMDVRLVPNMTTAEIIPMVRRHLDEHGFKEVKVNLLEAGYSWARTSYKEPAVKAVVKSYTEMGKEPEIWPTLAGSAPFTMFSQEPLKLPVIPGGLGHGALPHSPNEYIVLDEGGPTAGLATMEKSYVAILDNFGKMRP